MESFGKRIKELRQKRGMNQYQLADMMKSDQGNISYWERSLVPPLDAIIRVCEALNVTLAEFFDTQEQRSTKYTISKESYAIAEDMDRLDLKTKKYLAGVVKFMIETSPVLYGNSDQT